jgi:PPOX class probable F420-dependent enzyme
MSALPDPASDFGARVRARLDAETLIWLVTVGPSGTPQPNPVWFLFNPETESLLIYNDNSARRLANLEAHPQVAAHFDSDAAGDDIVVFTGQLERDTAAPAADRNEAYLHKYRNRIAGIGMDAEQFASKYSVALQLRIRKTRGF